MSLPHSHMGRDRGYYTRVNALTLPHFPSVVAPSCLHHASPPLPTLQPYTHRETHNVHTLTHAKTHVHTHTSTNAQTCTIATYYPDSRCFTYTSVSQISDLITKPYSGLGMSNEIAEVYHAVGLAQGKGAICNKPVPL